jgi:hypothetical protein
MDLLLNPTLRIARNGARILFFPQIFPLKSHVSVVLTEIVYTLMCLQTDPEYDGTSFVAQYILQ